VPRRVLSFRSLLAEPVAEAARKHLRPVPISRFCHRDPTRVVVSPGAVSRFGLARRVSRRWAGSRARTTSSIDFCNYDAIRGHPLRVLRFLARGSGMNQFTLAARDQRLPVWIASTASGAVACAISVSRFRAAHFRLRVNEGVAPADRHRVEDFALFPGARAPTQRRSNTPWSRVRACVALETPAAFRTDRGSDDETCPAKGVLRATPRSGVALPTVACEENRSAFHREGFSRERGDRSTRLERPASSPTLLRRMSSGVPTPLQLSVAFECLAVSTLTDSITVESSTDR